MQIKLPSKQTLLFLCTAIVFQGLTVAAEAQGRGGKSRSISHGGAASPPQARAVSQRAAPRTAPRATPRPARYPRRLVPPAGLGSAANVRPGFYQQLNAPRRHSGGGNVGVVPVYVYLQPALAPAPVPAPAPAPQPIYIVSPSEAPAVPQPVAPQPAAPTPPVPAPEPVVAKPPTPRSTEPGAVEFSVHPADARVYLDDDYLGTGAEIATIENGHSFAPGVHVLEVTHPEYRPQRLVFGVQSEEQTHVVIDLATDRVGRRSRIK